MTRLTQIAANAAQNAAQNTGKVAAKAATGKAIQTARPATAGLRQLLGQARGFQQSLRQAVGLGNLPLARKIQAELRPVISTMSKLGGSPERAALIARVAQASRKVDDHLIAANVKAVVADNGNATAPSVPVRPDEKNGGPLGGVGRALQAAGPKLDKAGHFVFFPLEALGRAIDPLKTKLGSALSNVKTAIDESPLGTAPVIGTATRFTTGLAASLVGMVDGAVTAVTHPVDLIKGVGQMAATVVSLVPGPRQAWDYAVHGTDPVTSYKNALGDAKELGLAFIEPSLNDFKAGNYAGGVGRLVGDIGSFFVSGGGTGAAKVGQVGVVTGRVGKLGKLGKAGQVAANTLRAGARVIGAVDDLSSKIVAAGFKANLSPATRAGKLIADAVPLKKAVSLADEAVTLQAQAAPPAVATRPKAAQAFAAADLAGEVRHAGPALDAAITAQKDVVGKLGGVPLYEHLGLQVSDAMFDIEAKVLKSIKDLKLNGKPVNSMADAAKAWKALPENAPQRAQIARQLASGMQEGFAEGLKFQPAAVEFTTLPDNIAGLQKDARVMLDPSLLNEDLDYLVHVMAEEQTHAYQRFLVDNQGALSVDKKVVEEIAQYTREFQKEAYLYPPAAGFGRLAEGVRHITDKVLKNLNDHADEVDFANLRREVLPGLQKGTPERAALDGWWQTVQPASERLSFLKAVNERLGAAMKTETGMKTWRMDFAERLPESITRHLDGPLNAPETQAAVKSAVEQAIKENQTVLANANNSISRTFDEWTDAYKNQKLEWTAKNVADWVSERFMAIAGY